MGGELGQWREWNEETSLDWHLLDQSLLDQSFHSGLHRLVRDLNRLYDDDASLWEADSRPEGFRWIDANDARGNTLAFMRIQPSTSRRIVCVCNFSALVRDDYRLALPLAGEYRQILNTDDAIYGGQGAGSVGPVMAEDGPWYGLEYSARLTLPPLACLWYEAPDEEQSDLMKGEGGEYTVT
jgi:1,4-alpha-glucan branching enzyme